MCVELCNDLLAQAAATSARKEGNANLAAVLKEIIASPRLDLPKLKGCTQKANLNQFLILLMKP